MRIGELAERVGVNPKTVRYYEGIGLLPDPERLPSGYREYSEDDVERVGFIRTAQRLGLKLGVARLDVGRYPHIRRSVALGPGLRYKG